MPGYHGVLSGCSDEPSSSVLVSSSCVTAALSGCTILLVSLTVVFGTEELSVSAGWVIVNESGDEVTVSEMVGLSLIAPLAVSAETNLPLLYRLRLYQ